MSWLRSWTGREFHKRGPAAAKVLSHRLLPRPYTVLPYIPYTNLQNDTIYTRMTALRQRKHWLYAYTHQRSFPAYTTRFRCLLCADGDLSRLIFANVNGALLDNAKTQTSTCFYALWDKAIGGRLVWCQNLPKTLKISLGNRKYTVK